VRASLRDLFYGYKMTQWAVLSEMERIHCGVVFGAELIMLPCAETVAAGRGTGKLTSLNPWREARACRGWSTLDPEASEVTRVHVQHVLSTAFSTTFVHPFLRPSLGGVEDGQPK